MSKLKSNAKEALHPLQSGHTILVGGFGLIGAPLTLIDELTKTDVNSLTVISNNLGESGRGLGIVLNQNKITKAIGSYFTSNRDVGDKYLKGQLEIELLPQGTLSESIRAGGAGLGGYFTPTAVGTKLAEGKEERIIDGKSYIFEKALRGDIAFIRAHKADTLGNLTYYKTARNFNPVMATAAKYVIAEVDEIVPAGQLDPESIITPHLYIDAIIEARCILTKEGVVIR